MRHKPQARNDYLYVSCSPGTLEEAVCCWCNCAGKERPSGDRSLPVLAEGTGKPLAPMRERKDRDRGTLHASTSGTGAKIDGLRSGASDIQDDDAPGTAIKCS
ncbi:uncharacterized protein LAJ45_09519 [Morchella importuna]|uniref:uncharacterized protein n=1 Tax=Morchella importuna TaxID=1174673 RepID=UPI001E8CDA32|nr:uncharacterized protein LAJ45_09519 [Morchella importuna]KAH8146326.1 hypothetical protein LAJ45_09519 [Morchella importuna]